MNNLLSRVALASMLMGASVMAMAATAAPEGAKVSIISPADGATVDKTFTVKFGVEGIKLAPAGDQTPHTGHHHLLIDVDQPIAAGQVIPADANHVHFGKALAQRQRFRFLIKLRGVHQVMFIGFERFIHVLDLA